MYCRESKEGLFFQTKGKSKRSLWPLIRKYCHPETEIVYTDCASQYRGVENLFVNGCQHKTTNHSRGEFVDPTDSSNTINPLENQNRHLKDSITSRGSGK